MSSSALCPACGSPIDALRAGHVAILDGAFRYFCNAACKSTWVDTTSRRPALDALTAEPPAVASAPIRSGFEPIVILEPRVVDDAEPPRSEPPSGVRESDAPEEPSFPAPPAVAEEDPPPPATMRSAPETAPASTRAPSSERRLAPARSTLQEKLVESAPIAGVLAGVLASVVSLAGEPAGMLRLPLALFAAAVFVVRKMLGARDRSEVTPWVLSAPLLAASVIALFSVSVHDAHADAHASFVGLAAASSLVVEVLVSRARRDVVRARASVGRALSVTARVVRGDTVTIVDASLVKPGEQVVVEAGETIAVDGIVAAGEAKVVPWFDASALVDRVEGDAVVAGASVTTGALRVNTTFSGAERAWLRLGGVAPLGRLEVAAPLVVLVRRSIERGAPIAGAVVASAVYANNGSWLDVAIAACGGGFALAATAGVAASAVAHARGHVAAQRRGIVYKDPSAFDAAARADVAVVCSRGTILLGEPEIVAVEAIAKDGLQPAASDRSLNGAVTEETGRVLAIAAGAELSSTHPFAAAILREARARGVRPENVRSALGHSGLGVTALAANGDRVIVGSRAFLLQEKVSVAIADKRTSALEAQGRSVLLVAVGGRLVGLLALQDGLRPGARAAIRRLHDARIEPVLLSGEARDTCETIARSLDIEHVRPEILPSDRGAEVRALSDGGRVVAALGHASTDDGALGAADVSIAMRAAGSAPGEWAVALASDDVRDAALSLSIPRAARDRARTTLVVSGLAQALGTLGIAFGVAPPAVVPVLGLLAAAATLEIVRDRDATTVRSEDEAS